MDDQATSRPVGLTARQQRFVDEYLVDLNATQAAIRAGYSKKTANPAGARLLAHVSVRAAIAKGREERLARVRRSADEVIFLLEDQSFADRSGMWGTRPDGTRYIKHPLDWPPELQRCIVSMEVVKANAVSGDGHQDTVWRIKLVSPLEAAKSLGLHHGLFVERHEHTHLVTVKERLRLGAERVSRKQLEPHQPVVIDVEPSG